MRAILMSIKPEWCDKIFSGEKTVEVRKTAPKLKPPFKVYMYESLGKKISCRQCAIWQNCPMRSPFGCNEGAGAVVGEFVCDEKHDIQFTGASYMINNDVSLTNGIARQSCLWFDDMFSYLGVKGGAALHITALKRYDTPKELSEFGRYETKLEIDVKGIETIIERHKKFIPLTRPPQSWMYVEEIEE